MPETASVSPDVGADRRNHWSDGETICVVETTAVRATLAERFGRLRAWSSCAGVACIALAGSTVVQAQGVRAADGGDAVTWTLDPVAVAGKSGHAVVNVRGTIRDGWHVYALKQAETGPTPLVVSVEQNAAATAAGAPVGSKPVVANDPAFGFVTPYYVRSLNVAVPVRLRPNLTPGQHAIPISVRYQSCDGRICVPPKTVHLTVQIAIPAKA